jgi:hypothetical protein
MEDIKHGEPAPEPAVPEVVKNDTDYDRGDPRALLIAGLGISGLILLVLIILGVQAYFDHVTEVATYDKVLSPVSDDLKNLRSQETEELNTYKYIDRNKGVVQIPISRAMELLAQEAAENKLTYFQKSTPVKVPTAPGAAPAAGAAAPPNGAAPQPADTGASVGTSSATGSTSKKKM